MAFEMTAATVKNYHIRWDKAINARVRNDLEIAQIAKEIRDEFPDGMAGDQMFMQFIKIEKKAGHFKGCRTDVMLTKALSFKAFSSDDWLRFGGWPGIGFLMKLSIPERRQLLKHFTGPGPFYYSALKHKAIEEEIDLPKSGLGRPTHEAVQHRNDVLAQYIAKLYKQYPQVLPPMPASVRSELTRKQQAAVGSRAAARA